MRRDTAGQGTFRRVCENVRRLREAGAEVNILCVVNGETAAHAREVLDALEKNGLQILSTEQQEDWCRVTAARAEA